MADASVLRGVKDRSFACMAAAIAAGALVAIFTAAHLCFLQPLESPKESPKGSDAKQMLMTDEVHETSIAKSPKTTKPVIKAKLTPPAETGIEELKPKVAATGLSETGRASWYKLASATASGEAMDEDDLTAAHPSFALGTKVLVENLDNGRSVVVRINDRGPFTPNRIIDVSKAAAEKLDMLADGLANVRVSRVEGDVASLPSPR